MTHNQGKKAGAVLAAGGQGLRCGAGTPKQFQTVNGKPMISYALESLCFLEEIEEVVVVVPEPFLEEGLRICAPFNKAVPVAGGNERWESVRNGFRHLSSNIEFVLIHDAARPFVPVSVIRDCLTRVRLGKNVIAAVPAVDTIKQVRGEEVENTLDRSHIIQVQTPQAFSRRVLESIYEKLEAGDPFGSSGFTSGEAQRNFTDEAGLAEIMQYPVYWTPGSAWSKKVTGPEDIRWASWMAGRIQTGEINLYV